MTIKERKKRRQSKRRNEGELDKCFKCPYEQCTKQYASDLALNLHMKNKHRGGTKKDRDRVAVPISLSLENDLKIINVRQTHPEI